MLTKLIAVVIHEIREELRKLDPPPPVYDAGYSHDPASTTAAQAERAASWDHDTKPPVRAFGFRAPDAG